MTGTVQGVGFRPFVYREATALGLAGSVANDPHGVVIEAEGSSDALDELCRRLCEQPPPAARVARLDSTDLLPRGEDGFAIVTSTAATTSALAPAAVSPDLGVCDACLAEVLDPADRRHRYPFANCTDCGPRYTIVRAVPYDRATTTMDGFEMCAACRGEYEDPADRRFHAEPVACPDCGPRLALERSDGAGSPRATGDAALLGAARVLREGGIVAVKGIGGYHLAVRADDAGAVARLRARKHRDDKPFAVMVGNAEDATTLVDLDDDGLAALTSWRRPVVLAPRQVGAPIAPRVAPGLADLGVVLAYTPLHHLLLHEVGGPLVMTSGNLSDEPIAHRDDEARRRLGPLADALLTHDRPIHVAAEDSVVRATGRGVQVLRRARGYAPEPFLLPIGGTATPDVLAVGAELKSTVTVATGSWAVTGPHLGDLEHPAATAAFEATVRHLCRAFAVAPTVVAHDRHPGYRSTQWARATELALEPVLHHHAHAAAGLVEHGRSGPALAVAYDGLGLGDRDALWGGELLDVDLVGCERVAHLRPVALPGGAAAIREPWRMAMAWMHAACGPEAAIALGERLDPRAGALVALLDGEGVPTTTSAGRLFDAVAAILGVRRVTSYEGQAAIELEALARRVPTGSAPAYPVSVDEQGPVPVLDPRPLIGAVLAAAAAGVPAPEVAAGFHDSFARATAGLAAALARARGRSTVVLTGGVFQNPRFAAVVADGLETAGLEVLAHRDIPPNDGGISLGQAAVARARAGVASSGQRAR